MPTTKANQFRDRPKNVSGKVAADWSGFLGAEDRLAWLALQSRESFVTLMRPKGQQPTKEPLIASF
jgi:hypothetical protein